MLAAWAFAIVGIQGPFASPADTLPGINLPPLQGTTNAGAFLPGVFKLDYTKDDLERVKGAGFRLVRIPVNGETARDPASLEKIGEIIERTGGHAIICFFDTKKPGEGNHGDGKPDDPGAVGSCWAAIHAKLKGHLSVKYELFNEPFGYPKTPQGAKQYVSDMRRIMRTGGLPEGRCIIDGVGYADNIQLVAKAGWDGELGYHFYPTWQAEGRRTQEGYSTKAQADLKGLSQRTHVTEFGAHLGLGDVYRHYTKDGSKGSADRNTLRGLHDAIIALHRAGKGVKSLCLWHGWPNGTATTSGTTRIASEPTRFALFSHSEGATSSVRSARLPPPLQLRPQQHERQRRGASRTWGSISSLVRHRAARIPLLRQDSNGQGGHEGEDMVFVAVSLCFFVGGTEKVTRLDSYEKDFRVKVVETEAVGTPTAAGARSLSVTLLELQPDESYRPKWHATLPNAQSPRQVVISAKGEYCVMVNDRGSDDAIILFGPGGKLIKRFPLADILTPEERARRIEVHLWPAGGGPHRTEFQWFHGARIDDQTLRVVVQIELMFDYRQGLLGPARPGPTPSRVGVEVEVGLLGGVVLAKRSVRLPFDTDVLGR